MKTILPEGFFRRDGKRPSKAAKIGSPKWRHRLRSTVTSTQVKRRNVKVGMPKFNLPEVDDGDGS